ncbi:hypothetical protein DPMN_024890 [Dreissena polymorpha]|uniref:Uncharacterized protein n=1 Tax=Dreissena polymorpha TaxID=45954 RepID=A0A9D4LQ03_DREPO|nr:hypothetical protein DPMN_024890 [Dreissena polymorpha]
MCILSAGSGPPRPPVLYATISAAPSLFRWCSETNIHLRTITIPLGDPSKFCELTKSAGEDVRSRPQNETTIHLRTITVSFGDSSEYSKKSSVGDSRPGRDVYAPAAYRALLNWGILLQL